MVVVCSKCCQLVLARSGQQGWSPDIARNQEVTTFVDTGGHTARGGCGRKHGGSNPSRGHRLSVPQAEPPLSLL